MSQERVVPPFPVGPSSIDEIWQRRDPDSIAIVDDAHTITTAELRTEVDRVARCLRAMRDTDEEFRVLWLLGNDPTSIISLLATITAGGVWIGVDRRATEPERRRLVDTAAPALVLDRLPTGDPDAELPSLSRTAVGAIAYTSGTTGAPKGVVHTAQQLLFPAAAAIETEELGPASRIGTPLPLATLNILLLGPVTALACGGIAVMMSRADAAGFAADVQRHAVTRALVVPTIVQDLVDAGIAPAQLATLDRLIMGGAGIDRERASAAQDQLGVPLVASYGLSEAPTGVARMNIGESGARPLPGVDIRIEADGEITIAPTESGPWAGCWRGAIGYRGDTAGELWRNGRIHTGDSGWFDDHGRLHVAGRMSEMINRGGATIAPREVETALLASPGVRDAAVVGLPDPRLGETVAAAVVGAVDVARVRDAVRERLSGYKVPMHLLVVDEIPRNRGGKVDRAALRALFDPL